MKVTINSVHFKADARLEDFIREKTAKLAGMFDGVIGCDVFLRVDSATNNENKTAEIRLLIPGNDLFAKKTAKTFEEAVDNVVDALKRQVKKHKEKLRGV